MIDKDLIEAKFDIIEMNLKFLEEFKNTNVQFLENNYKDLQAVKYSLFEICEACIDVANHVIAVKNFERAEDYSKMFEVLAKNRIIPENLGKKLGKMAKFRNLLVHRYAEIKTEKLIRIIKFDLVDIVKFMKEIKKFLKEKNKK